VDGSPITSVLSEPHPSWRQHEFRGGNFLLARFLHRDGPALKSSLSPRELAVGIRQTLDFLTTQAASLSLKVVRVDDARLEATVLVDNFTGHKLPTAYPSRRAWIHLAVRNRSGQVVFESGALQADGSIRGNDNDADALGYEPHYTRIERPDQVQIYESIMGDDAGRPTTGLLTGTRYLKDNRLLPRGFDARTAAADIAVQGGATQDPDFVGGSDRVTYVLATDPAMRPYRVVAELWYEPVGYRWAHNLDSYAAPEPRRFVSYYGQVARVSATRLARAETFQP
jgi:hypothetical protein